MKIGTMATALATLALLAALTVGVLVAAPSIALALQQPSDTSTTATAAASTKQAHPSPIPPSTTPTPASTYSGPLVAPRGSRQITRRELHTWTTSRPFYGEDPQNDAIAEQQRWLDIKCMARKGFLYDPTNPQLQGHEASTADGLTAKQADAYFTAMWGPETSAPYDWHTAGCHGRSVHLTGQDNAH